MLGIKHEPTQTVLVHCAHLITGAYRAPGRPWKVIRGIEAGNFRDVIVSVLTAGELLAEIKRLEARLKLLMSADADG